MQRYTISTNAFYDETMTLFSLSKVYTKPKVGVTPLVEINSTELNDSFEDNNDYSKFISVFNFDDDHIIDISANDLMELSDLYFSKDRDNRNIDDINILSLHRYDEIKEKLNKEEIIIFNVSAFYQEIKVDEAHNNSKYKEYQSFYSELEDKDGFVMTDNFYYGDKEYPANTLFIFADYNQTDFIIIQYSPHKCLVKLPVADETKIAIGKTAMVDLKTTLKLDNDELFDRYSEEVYILAKTKEEYIVTENGVEKAYTHNWVIFLMDCTRDVKTTSFGLMYLQNPYYRIPFGNEPPPVALIPYLYLSVNSDYHRFFPSFTALGLDYASDLFPLYYDDINFDEDGVETHNRINIFTLLGDANTKWDYLNESTLRLPLEKVSDYLKDDCTLPIKTILLNILSEEDVLECKKMEELILERQTKEIELYNNGDQLANFAITDQFVNIYAKQANFFHYDINFVKDIVDEDGVPLVFSGFITEDNPLPIKIDYEGLFKLTIAEPPVRLSIPISQTFDIDTYQDEIVKENYLSSLVDAQVNDIIDMERNCYHPMWCVKPGEFKEIREIQYAFHFKKRDSNYQLVKEEGNNYWQDNVSQHKSDMLGEIGFTNRDVYYQKTCLKMSFIRSTYYNTPSTANQDVLCYNTSFMDYRKLYQLLSMNPELTVNRAKDDMRLDATITVKDKYSSLNSSEGFYIYVWRNTDKIELYNAIDFNNAKYGVTSPMMLAKTEDTKPVFPSTFQGVADARHIKWIGEYNEDMKKYIYYIDPDFKSKWGNCIEFDQGVLKIGLWEISISQK